MEAEEVLQLHVETENCDNGALSSTDHEAVLTLRVFSSVLAHDMQHA